jgi:hypothetical protein
MCWRRPQWTIRWFFLLLTALGVALVVVAHFRTIGLERRRIVASLESQGAVVSFSAEPETRSVAALDWLTGPEIVGVSFAENSERLNSARLAELGPVRGLRSLTIDFSELDEEGRRALGTLSQLRVLSAEHTHLDDRAMETLTSLPDLEELHLRRCPITDAGLETLTQLKKLTTLSISASQVTWKGIQCLQKLPKLRFLDLSECNLSSQQDGPDAPASFPNLPCLEELSLSAAWIDSDRVASLRNSATLKILDISNCRFDGRMLLEIGSFTTLESLTIDAEAMSPKGLLALRGLVNLRFLCVTECLLPDDNNRLQDVVWTRVPLPSGSLEEVPVLVGRNTDEIREALRKLCTALPELKLEAPPDGPFADHRGGQRAIYPPRRNAVQGTGCF